MASPVSRTSSRKKSTLSQGVAFIKDRMKERRLSQASAVTYDEWGDEEEPVRRSVSTASELSGVIRRASTSSWESVKQTDWKEQFKSMFRRKRPQQEDDLSDYSDSDDEMMVSTSSGLWRSEQRRDKKSRKRKKSGQLSVQEVMAIAALVKENLKIGRSDDPDEPPQSCWRKLRRVLGIDHFLVILEVKKIVVEREKPDYPYVHKVVNTLLFEAVVGLLIILNAINIGFDSMYPEEGAPTWIAFFDHLFTAIFLVEWTLRVMAFSWAWIFSPMNIFDTIIVWVIGVLVSWILTPAGLDVDVLQRFAALRVLRIARLIRAIRIMPYFRELWTLVNGMMTCVNLLFWAMVIAGVVHFMFAVAVVEMIGKSPVFEEDDYVQAHFSDMANSMFSLFGMMTFDMWGGLVRHITNVMPESMVVFILFTSLTGIVLVNLMIAIVIMNAFKSHENDAEAVAHHKAEQAAKWTNQLRRIFNEMDEDGSGRLSREEFYDIMDDILFIQTMKRLDIDIEELPEVFDLLDDGDGEITVDEFCSGLMRMQGIAMSREMMRATKKVNQLNECFLYIEGKLHLHATEPLELACEDLDATHDYFHSLQGHVANTLTQLEKIGVRQAMRKCVAELPEAPPVEAPTMSAARSVAPGAPLTTPGGLQVGADDGERMPSRTRVRFEETELALPPPHWIERRRQQRAEEKLEKLKTSGDFKKLLKRGAFSKHKQKPSDVRDHFKDIWEALDLPFQAMPDALRPIITPEGVFKPKAVSGMPHQLTFIPQIPPGRQAPLPAVKDDDIEEIELSPVHRSASQKSAGRSPSHRSPSHRGPGT